MLIILIYLLENANYEKKALYVYSMKLAWKENIKYVECIPILWTEFRKNLQTDGS